MIKSRSDTEVLYRSLLQKAVRRGHVDLVFTTSALLESLSSKEKNWYRTRTAIITFEECWPLGSELIFNRKFHSKVAALIKVTKSLKSRDASGLGYMAFAFHEGDPSIFDGSPDDKHLRIIAHAIERPDDFWHWIFSQRIPEERISLVENAERFKDEGSPRDKAVLQAAAYLALTEQAPACRELAPTDQAFPYWVAFDRHTPEGKLVLRDVARDLRIPLLQLEWSCFYFEGALTNGEAPSKWWERYCRWRFKKVDLPAEEAHLLWDPAKSQVIESLNQESRHLKNELYRWKLANLKSIESLKRQVDLFNQHFEEIQRDRMDLFGRYDLDNFQSE